MWLISVYTITLISKPPCVKISAILVPGEAR